MVSEIIIPRVKNWCYNTYYLQLTITVCGEVYAISIELVAHPINAVEPYFAFLGIECNTVLPISFKHLSQVYQQI